MHGPKSSRQALRKAGADMAQSSAEMWHQGTEAGGGTSPEGVGPDFLGFTRRKTKHMFRFRAMAHKCQQSSGHRNTCESEVFTNWPGDTSHTRFNKRGYISPQLGPHQ